MIIFLLLSFSLATDVPGSEKSGNWSGCEGGWIIFTFKKLDNNSLTINKSRITQNKGKHFTVKNLHQEDHGKSIQGKIIEIVNCGPQVNHTAYNKAQTTVNCSRPESTNKTDIFLCKETADFVCMDVWEMNQHGKVGESLDSNGLNVTITNVASEEQGIYWCATYNYHYHYIKSYRKINVSVRSDFSDHQEYPVVGHNLKHSCEYSKEHRESKFFCKGEDPMTCNHLVTSEEPRPKKFVLKDDFEKKRILITMYNITAEDKGIYWFGAGNSGEHGNEIFCRLELTVVPQCPPQTGFKGVRDSVIIILSVVVLVLLVIVLILIKKDKRRNEAPAQDNRREEYVYEEIPTPTTRIAVTTVYATVDPKEPGRHLGPDGKSNSASHSEYSTVFNKSTDECTIHTAPPGPLYSNVIPHK